MLAISGPMLKGSPEGGVAMAGVVVVSGCVLHDRPLQVLRWPVQAEVQELLVQELLVLVLKARGEVLVELG